ALSTQIRHTANSAVPCGKQMQGRRVKNGECPQLSHRLWRLPQTLGVCGVCEVGLDQSQIRVAAFNELGKDAGIRELVDFNSRGAMVGDDFLQRYTMKGCRLSETAS